MPQLKILNPIKGDAPEICSNNEKENQYLLSEKLVDTLIILLFALFMCLYKIGDGSFGSGDQTTHSIVVQTMVKTDNYVTPHYLDKIYYNKPPFKMWLAAIVVNFLGNSNFAYRCIDGLTGVAICLTVFYFSVALFRRRFYGYFSLFSLCSASMFFYGHGVRNAVQDSMMLLMMTIGIICAWFFIERVLSKDQLNVDDKKYINILSVIGGLCIGLSALSKNVAGYWSLILIFSYLLFTGNLLRLLKNAGIQMFTVLILSILPPASFILAQGENAKMAFEQLLVTEVFKRATKGYHHTKNTFFYYYIIVKDRLFIAPELLFPSLMFASYCCVRKYDRKYFFLLLWTILPIVGQSLAKSKLEWYILPALPAASILSGLMLGKLWEQVQKGLQRYFSNKQSMDLRATLSSFALFFFLSSIAISIYSVADIFLNQQNRNDADLITSDLLDYQKVSGKQFQLIFYNQPKLAAHELFYFNLLNYKSINNMKNLQDEILNADMIITNTSEIAEIAKLRPFTSYTILKGRDLRYRKLVIISYIQEIVPRPLRQVFKTVDFNDDVNVRAYGFKNPVFLPSKEKVYPSVGEKSAMLIDTDKFYNLLNTELRINLASLSPEQNGKLKVGIYINETKITDIENILKGLHWYSLQVPAGVWQEGINSLTLKYELPNSEQIDSTIQLALFNQLEIALKQE